MEKLFRKKYLLDGIVLFLWGFLSLGCLLVHEPWRDELQAWLIARDCSIPELFAVMKDEGHFLGWFLLLRLLAVLKQPVFSISILSWLLTVPAVCLLLFRSPFGKGTKLLLVLSSPVLYWFPAVSRCYSLALPLLFLTAVLYPDRKKQPFLYGTVLLILGNVHPILEGILLFLFLDLLRDWKRDPAPDRKNYLYSAFLLLAGVLCAFLTVIGAAGKHGTVVKGGWESLIWDLPIWNVHPMGLAWIPCPSRYLFLPAAAGAVLILFLACRKHKMLRLFFAVCTVLFCVVTILFLRNGNRFLNPSLLLYGLGLAALLIPFSRKDRFYAAGMILFFLWYAFLSVFFCGIIMQRAFFPLLTAVFMMWIASERMPEDGRRDFLNRRKWNLILLAWLTVPGGLYVLAADAVRPFSGSEECGQFIASMPGKHDAAVFYGDDSYSALSAFTGEKIYYADLGRACTFYPQHAEKKMDVRAFLTQGKLDHTFVIFRKTPGLPEQFRQGKLIYRKVYETAAEPMIAEESYTVYRKEKSPDPPIK